MLRINPTICATVLGLSLLLINNSSFAHNLFFVERNMVKLSRILKLKNPTKRTAQLIKELHRRFDYKEFESLVMYDISTSLTSPQRTRFSNAFKTMFERKILTLVNDDSLQCKKYLVTKGNHKTEIVVACPGQEKPNSLTLHFSQTGRKRIIDISFSGALLSRNYRGVINKTLRRDGPEVLIRKLESKSANSLTAKSLL